MSQNWPPFAGSPVVPVTQQEIPNSHSSLFPNHLSVIYVGVPKSLPMIRYHSEPSVSKDMLEQCTPASEDVRVFRKRISAGSFGVSFEACLQDQCDYVAKLVKIADDEEKQAFRMECALAKHASLHGFGPIVRRVSLCVPAPDNDETEMFGIIIMEKLKCTLDFYRKKYELTEADCDSILEAMTKMHESGIWHSDLHDGNIMQRFDGSFVMIDFGMSWPLFTSVPCYCVVPIWLHGCMQDFATMERRPITPQSSARVCLVVCLVIVFVAWPNEPVFPRKSLGW